MSRIIRKPAFCICENKGADQLHGKPFTAQLICAFVLADAKSKFSHDVAHIETIKTVLLFLQPIIRNIDRRTGASCSKYHYHANMSV